MLAQSAQECGNRKHYDPPFLRKLRPEQATLFLVGHAYIGHHGANEILEVLFPVATNAGPYLATCVAEESDPYR
jgi:hypothetical protein